MRKPVLSWVVALCGILLFLSTNAAWAERRVALVVGNSQYKNPSLVLLNPKNDAEDVAAVLRSLDFEVIFTADAGKRDLDLAMTQFARLATGADAALFFYAGHALQYQGRNYLMPIDGELEDEISLRYQMTLLDDVRAAVERADGVKIIILDACRNNPVVDSLRRKMSGASRGFETTRGLARIDKALGMVVAYATAADDVAADGTGRNSPFTSALLRRLQEPGLEIGTLFRRVAADVNEKTNGRQRPETYVSLIGEYFLNQKDRLSWEQIKESADPAAFRDFIIRFPSSPRASDARFSLQLLERLAREKPIEQQKTASLTPAPAPVPTPPSVERPSREKSVTEKPTSEKPLVEKPIERVRDEDKAAKVATERQKIVSVTPAPAATPAPTPAPTVLPLPQQTNLQPSPIPQEQICKRDEERLARVRASQSRDEVIRLERELGCDRLRPQVLRLRESLVADASIGEVAAAPPSPLKQLPQPTPAPQATPAPQPPAQLSPAQPAQSAQLSPAQQDQACKRDEERLARLRVSQSREEVIRFERELGCARLRAQVVRLRESVGAN